jgi:hypothetical protein
MQISTCFQRIAVGVKPDNHILVQLTHLDTDPHNEPQSKTYVVRCYVTTGVTVVTTGVTTAVKVQLWLHLLKNLYLE